MKAFKRYIVAFLLGMMSIVIVPVEFVHSFFDHTDSEDSIHDKPGVSIENAHRHCLILKTEFREFLLLTQDNLEYSTLPLGTLSYYYVSPHVLLNCYHHEQRGPPFTGVLLA